MPKKIFIMGASTGIGRALAQEYSKQNVILGLAARRLELLEEVAEICRKSNTETHIYKVDVTNENECSNSANDFINITGGIKIDDPALDLAVIFSILASNTNLSIENGLCFCAEVGLSGELRNVKNIDIRISEAERLGYSKIIISSNSKTQNKTTQIEILKFSKLSDVVKEVFKEQD